MRSFVLDTELTFDPEIYHIGLHKVDHDVLKWRDPCGLIYFIEFDICILNNLKLVDFGVSWDEPVRLNWKVVQPHPFVFILHELFLEKQDLLARFCDENFIFIKYRVSESKIWYFFELVILRLLSLNCAQQALSIEQ